MGVKGKVLFLLTGLLFIVNISHANWVGPENTLTVNLGAGIGELAIKHSDSGDELPNLIAVLKDKIVISDPINHKQVVYGINGGLVEEIHWVLKESSGSSKRYNIPRYAFLKVLGFEGDSGVYSKIVGTYLFFSPTGEMVHKYTERPLALGEEKSSTKQSDGSYLIEIAYADAVYKVIASEMFEYFTRDLSGYLYGTILVGDEDNMNYRVIKYNMSGTKLGELDMPSDNIISAPEVIPPRPTPQLTHVAQYGPPVISPNGDVYTWKRTPDTYSIIKWVWQDTP